MDEIGSIFMTCRENRTSCLASHNDATGDPEIDTGATWKITPEPSGDLQSIGQSVLEQSHKDKRGAQVTRKKVQFYIKLGTGHRNARRSGFELVWSV